MFPLEGFFHLIWQITKPIWIKNILSFSRFWEQVSEEDLKEDIGTIEVDLGKDCSLNTNIEVSGLVETNPIVDPHSRKALLPAKIAYIGTAQPPIPNFYNIIPGIHIGIIKKSRLQPNDVALNTHRVGIPIENRNPTLCIRRHQIKSMDSSLGPNRINSVGIAQAVKNL